MPKGLESLLLMLYCVIAIGIIAVILSFVIAVKRRSSTDQDAPASFPYERINWLFTKAERSFLGVLDGVIGPDYRVFGKVRVADIIRVNKGLSRSETQSAKNQILSKHFDFVICRVSNLSVSLVIELDDSTHKQAARKSRDAFIEQATQAAGIPLLRVPCQATYSPQELTELLSPHLSEFGETILAARGD